MSSRSKLTAAPVGAVLVGAVLMGAVLGVWGARTSSESFLAPGSPDAEVWELVIPGRAEDRDALTTPALGRGTLIRGGMLRLGEHAFNRSDTLRPVDDRPVAEVRIDVGAGSVRLNFTGVSAQHAAVFLTPDAVRIGGVPRARPPEPLRFTVEDGVVAAHLEGGPVPVAEASPGTIELQSDDDGGVLSVALVDAAGDTWLDQDFTAQSARFSDTEGATLGALAGLALGAALAWAPGWGGAALALLLAALPLAVLRVPFDAWVGRVEVLYLTRTPAWELARLALAVSLAPLALVAAARAPWMPVTRTSRLRRRAHTGAWIAAALAAAALASRGGPWALLLPGALFLALPLTLALQARLALLPWLLRDAPAMLAVAIGGWAAAPLAVAWRFMPPVASRGLLLSQAPRPATDYLFLLLLCAPLSLELALRSTYLAESWRPEVLAARSSQVDTDAGALDTRLTPHWSASCGSGEPISLVVAGGSSTGGAYQFRGQADAFFPARLHARLCEALPDGVALTTWNYGAGGRDTHVIAGAMLPILEHTDADMLVLHVGVNDLLTTDATMTRREREALGATSVSGALSGAGSRSLVVTGLGLWSREAPSEQGDAEALVSEVPLPDAADNLSRIAAQTASRSTPLLLVSQVVTASVRPSLEPYWAMEEELAGALSGVDYRDIRPVFEELDERDYLLDRNHLSQQGHERLAEALLPAVAEALNLEVDIRY